jgi:hypothetical protein
LFTKSLIKEEIARWLPVFRTSQLFCNFLLRLTLLAWVVAKVITYKLWLSNRFFPVVSPFGISISFPFWFHGFLYVTGLLLSVCIFIFPQKNKPLVALLIAELASCLLDQMRWQPWEYQYILTLFVFLINRNQKDRIVAMLHLLLIATYIYSGIHKFNREFITIFWQNTILEHLLYLPPNISNAPLLARTGYLLPLIETMGGLMLLFKRVQQSGAIMLILMHIVILAIIGPLGTNYNASVWPWNILMIAYLFFIFLWYKPKENILSIFDKPRSNFLIIALMVLMPAFNFIGLWPLYLSFGLYSGKAKLIIITVEDDKKVLNDLSSFFEKENDDENCTECNNVHLIRLSNWAFKEMNTAPYPDDKAYRNIMLIFKKKYPASNARFYEFHIPYKASELKEIKE